jgi:hypothetical protein
LAAARVAKGEAATAASKPAAPPSPPASALAGSRPAVLPQPSVPWHVELAALGFGVHDGDAGTLGAGAEGVFLRRWLLLVGTAEWAAERARTLGAAQAGYGFVRMGLGLGVRTSWPRAFVDVSLGPALVRYSLRGIGVLQSNDWSAWGGEVDGRLRLGWRFGRVAPFLYLGASWSLLRERLWLDDASAPITLSRANVAAGLGISVAIH